MNNLLDKSLDFLGKSRFGAILAIIVFFIVFYLGANHFSFLPIHALPLFGWEKSIPFLPWTVIFYFLAYVQVVFVLSLIDKSELKKALSGLLALIAFHGLFFFLFPTAYPRPPFPTDGSLLSDLGYRLIIFLDNPNNCFPSLHVAISLFSLLLVRKKSLTVKISFGLITALTIASTLTLKQHFFIDIIGGIATALFFYYLFLYEPRRQS